MSNIEFIDGEVVSTDDCITVDGDLCGPLRVKLIRPLGEDGKSRDQTGEATAHMRYAATLNLPRVTMKREPYPVDHHAVIVGGGPSIKDYLEQIRALAADPKNKIYALNWAHTWLIKNGIVPNACLLFEIDAEPDDILLGAHKDVTYYICSHCHNKTFDQLVGFKRVLWHSLPNSEGEKQVAEEFFKSDIKLGGGVATFLRTISLAIAEGYRNFDIFGCDSSFPDGAKSTHVEGYPAIVTPKDSFDVWAGRKDGTAPITKFRTVGYLAHQVEEFKQYCVLNHQFFFMRVHGDTLLGFVHRHMWPDQYNPDLVPTLQQAAV